MGQQTLTDETAMRQSSGESTATGLASEVSERTEVYNQRGEKRTSGDINDIDEEADEEEEGELEGRKSQHCPSPTAFARPVMVGSKRMPHKLLKWHAPR